MLRNLRSTLRITRNDRVFIVGSTGSGKTTLAKALLYDSPNVVVLDPKHTFTLPLAWKHTIYKSVSELSNHPDTSTAIYRPQTIEEMDDGCPDFFNWCFDRKNTLIFVDEVMSVTNATRIGKAYARVLQLGRERGVGCWNATQRPANIPRAIMTESEHYLVFTLRSVEDRRRIYDYTGQPEFLNNPRHEHGFYYYNARTGKVVYYAKANIGKVLE